MALLALCGCAGAGQRLLARGALAYDVAAAGDVIATVELETEFRLVLRRAGAVRAVPLGPPDRDVVAVALDGDGRRAAVAGLDGVVRLFAVASATELGAWRLDGAATAVALAPDGAWLVTGADSGVLCLRRCPDGALLQCVAAHDGRVAAVAFDGAGALVSAGRDGQAIVWDVPSLRIRARRATGGPVHALAARAGTVALAGAARVVLWRWATGALDELPGAARALAFVPDGRLARAAPDGRIRLGADRELGRFAGAPRGLAVSGDGRWLLVAGWSGVDPHGPSLAAMPLP